MLLMALAAPMRALVRGPDAGGYQATDATVYSFVDVSAGGASVLAGTDDGSAPLALPFAFTFYGQSYSMVCVSANGVLYFVASAAVCSNLNDFANIDLALTTPNNWPALFPYWSDLTFQVPGAGSVFYQTVGAAGSRRFIVQWNNAVPGSAATATSAVTFQTLLVEGSNDILFQYKTVTLDAGNPASSGAQATVGIRNADGSTNNKLIEWSFNAPVLRDSMAIRFSGTVANAPPVTTAATSGRTGANGWFKGPVRVTLTATDPDSPSVTTSYRIDGGAQTTYAGPFTLRENGIHHVTYFSVDSSSNQEQPKELELKIDERAPTVTAAANPKSLWPANNKKVNVTVSGRITDAVSGVDRSSARYSVVDSAGRVQPSGTITVGPQGTYSFVVALVAGRDDNGKHDSDHRGRDDDDDDFRRDGKDRVERRYKITVQAADLAGNTESEVVVVDVVRDHDRR
jgi:hypothetical protein